nr:MAG TPA: hypothetical protein [Caudoviricetes sp.]
MEHYLPTKLFPQHIELLGRRFAEYLLHCMLQLVLLHLRPWKTAQHHSSVIPHSKIRNSVNQITFSVTVMIISHAQITIVKASTCPKNIPSFVQISFILINPFEPCKVSNTNMSALTEMNRLKLHAAIKMVNRIV